MEGVFPLPEAQLDRFLMKLVLPMPDLETLTRIGARAEDPPALTAVTGPEELLAVQAAARSMPSAPHVERFAAALVLATHAPPEVRYGAGPRAVQALMRCARVHALLRQRAAVAVEDVVRVASDVLTHRVVLGFEAEAQGLDAARMVRRALEATEVR
jgi:MoxR-like ATPase